jgi:tubulin delta
MNNVVFPHSTGEVVVQSYNALLTMSHVLGGSASGSNAVLCSFNDRAHSACTNMMRIKRPSITDLNQVLARDLALALLPSSTSLSPFHSRAWGRDVLGSLASRLCPHPNLKLLDAISVPQMPFESIQYSALSWDSLLKVRYALGLSRSMSVANSWIHALSGSVQYFLFCFATQVAR